MLLVARAGPEVPDFLRLYVTWSERGAVQGRGGKLKNWQWRCVTRDGLSNAWNRGYKWRQ